MKTLLAAIGVLFFYAHQIAAEQLVASCEYPKDWKEKELKRLNGHRQRMAEKYNISNMHEIISYNYELEKEVQKMKTCADVKHGSNYRVNNHSSPDAYNVMGKLFEDNTQQMFLHHIEQIEAIHPLQSSVAVCRINPFCRSFYPKVNSRYRLNEFEEIQNILIYGSTGTFSSSDVKFGLPGSDCPNGKAESGLCKSHEVKNPKSPISNEETASGESSKNPSANKTSALSHLSLFFFQIVLVILLA